MQNGPLAVLFSLFFVIHKFDIILLTTLGSFQCVGYIYLTFLLEPGSNFGGFSKNLILKAT